MRAALALLVLALIGLLGRPSAAALSARPDATSFFAAGNAASAHSDSPPGPTAPGGAETGTEDAESNGELEGDDGPGEARAPGPLLPVAAPALTDAALGS
ncbi:MAG: hypothetical protein FJ104_06835, partial [Deltaproteobacteria bacterium]|nr:hypothetical protein [Deltaproteobacteria bacterium]